MNLWLPSSDQADLADAISGAITDKLPLDRLHGQRASDRYRLAELAEIGVFGIGLSEESGGSGLGVVEEALVFENLGYQLASPAVLATVLAAHASAAPDGLISGEHGANIAIVKDDLSILLFDASEHGPTIVLTASNAQASETTPPLTSIAHNPWQVGLDQARLDSSSLKMIDGLGLRARLLIAAQLSGLSRRALDMAVEYAKIREQFGKPIGSFQAVKHHAANMAVATLAARDLVAFGAVALEQSRADAAFQIEAALLTSIKAARDNAGTNIQIHGGIGFSDECDAHLVLKNAQVWIAIAGGEAAARTALLNETSPLSSHFS